MLCFLRRKNWALKGLKRLKRYEDLLSWLPEAFSLSEPRLAGPSNVTIGGGPNKYINVSMVQKILQ
jgi:hypothetical protein